MAWAQHNMFFILHACKHGLVHTHGQQNKLYKHVHVLRCDFPHDTRSKPTKEFLTVKQKPIDLGVSLLIISSVILG